MLAYVDSSVLLRYVLGESNQLKEFKEVSIAVSSELIRVESLRTCDRYRLQTGMSEAKYVQRVSFLHELLMSFELVRLTPAILSRASQPFPTGLGTLDALHLSTCLLYAERNRKKVTLMTHDESLKNAGKAIGLEVLG